MSEIMGILCLVFIIFIYKKSKEFSNPYKLIMVIGKKGAGKTTDICKLNMKYRKYGWNTYSTEYMPDCYHLDPNDIGYYEFKRNSCVLIDEVGLIWHARDFKTFPKEIREWFKLQRHRHLTVYCYSQSFDIDKGLRDLCDEIWIIKKYFGVLSVKKKVIKEIGIVEASSEGESRFVDNLKVVPWFVPGARKFTYIPKYAKYFDSFTAPPLGIKEFSYIPKRIFSRLHLRVQLHLARIELRYFRIWLCTRLLTEIYKKGWIKWL